MREWPPENKTWFMIRRDEGNVPTVVMHVSGDIQNVKIGPRHKEVTLDLRPWQLDELIKRAQQTKEIIG